MGRPIVDVRHVADGEFHFNTTAIVGKIPNPVIQLLVRQIQKILADTKYVNVTVTIVKAPPLEETVDPQGRVGFRLKHDDPQKRGPEIEIRTLDGLLAGSYTLAMTRTGIAASFPPPRQLLKQVTWGRNKANRTQPAAVGYPAQPTAIGYQGQPAAISYPSNPGAMGYGQATRGLDEQRQGYGQAPRGFGGQPSGNGRAPGPLRQGYGQTPQKFDAQKLPGQAPRTFGGQQGQARHGFDAQRDVHGPDERGFGGRQPEPGLPRTDSARFYSSAPTGLQPPRPVAASRMPTSSAPRRAPVPPNAFSRPPAGHGQAGGQQQRFDNNPKREKSSGGGCCSGGGDDDEDGQRQGRNGQPQRGYGDRQGRQQGFNKNSRREKSGGGCCSGGGDDDGGAPARSAYDRLGDPKEDRKKFEKERNKREKEERKKMEEWRKTQKKKGKNTGGYSAPEKSGFYDDKQSDGGCCGMSCC
ncbi:hypothetical protein EPUS_04065 [Endocarpon pusillum Z07020]|uniref:Uncharacterized protein n=1 Tax=Endocarpon pusillum (strain Z07020 / HMAS-L-300199) TaxID=1263415 RepID=U1G7N8_ENDPU|nr:uncharacterized protein EPUS_04065 [Endocarpon pusillum Z07020]ERF73442.1 hypothetical protein EPUS_04065 [Endocarpon pusillum Z07020]